MGVVRAVPFSLLPEMASAGARRMLAPLRIATRRSWFYRRLLKGALADHFVFHPHDALPRKLEDADALLRGRFRFHGVYRRQRRFDIQIATDHRVEAENSVQKIAGVVRRQRHNTSGIRWRDGA